MDIRQIWPQLSASTREWLIEHNGEPLPGNIVDDLLAVTHGDTDESWWNNDPDEGESQLTDEAVDWIDETANDE